MSKLRAMPVITLLLVLTMLVPAYSSRATQGGDLAAQFQTAASKYRVPVDLLLAIGYVNTHWEMPSTPSEVGEGYGVMNLVMDSPADTAGNTLTKASKLTGIPQSALRTSSADNILGGAALLSDLEGQSRPSNLSDWYPAVERMGGEIFAQQVYTTLKTGVARTLPSGETITLSAHPEISSSFTNAPTTEKPSYTRTAATTTFTSSGAEYSGALWVPASSNNYTTSNRPTSYPINLVVIHVTQGSYGSAINWFQDPNAQVSAHYVIRSSDGQITQMVHHKDIAWHAGNWDYNTRAIGIEHEGYIDDPSWFTDTMYRSSAKLVAWLCYEYNIPVDRQHIVGHDEVPDPNNPGQYGGVDHHQDPGPYWDWTKYMGYVQQYYSYDASASDTTAPTAWVWTPKYSTNSTSSLDFPVTWGGSDSGSGVNHYQVQWASGGSYTDWLQSTMGKSATFGYAGSPVRVTPGRTYYVRARSIDNAGNTSPWRYSHTSVPLDDTSPSYAGSWSTVTGASTHYLSTLHYTSTGGASLQLRFYGRTLAWIGDEGPDKGEAAVYIDGTNDGTVDTYSSNWRDRVVVFDKSLGSRDAWHTIRIIPAGAHNPASSGSRVDIDAVARVG